MGAENLPAVREEHIGTVANWSPNPFEGKKYLYTSIPTDTEAGKRLVLKCSQKGDFGTDDTIGEEIAVENVLCHMVELTNPESGEVVQAIRTVLVDPEGQTFAFVSKGIFDSLIWMGHLWGPPPWKGGKVVKLAQETTRNKRRILKLEAVEGKD